jgi:outer membrane receptor for Fe3+-dicitrate
MEMFGRYALLVLWIAANIFFLVYEYTLGQMIRLYVSWFRKQILRRK